MSDDALVCARCGTPVTVNRENYELFDRMHWLCFHLEFEHDADVDAQCSDPSCPWFIIEALRRGLTDAGVDPTVILMNAISRRIATAI
ncbi:MAG: hypothetical protein ABI664_04860 [bacterium]